MKKQNSFTGFLLLGLGGYFLLRQFNIPFLNPFYSWPTILIIIGAALLLHNYFSKDSSTLLPGIILTGFGIHFHGLERYPNWIDHWAVYTLIIGTGFFIKYLKTKSGIIPALVLLGLSIFALFSTSNPEWFEYISVVITFVERFWPVVLVIAGVYILKKK
ncbi:LiaI-LiaF-like domain-containing protein [Halobacillus massiliensis]|uniref:LiaI-LiaF-like domain-containing protein n=1 Tax=Halobacillus massiliensis TaxID=1926286 RepID=UPI0009E5A4DF|nr:DUF5668 domain-containing protein [Halobacillus massiliensis]